MPELRRRHKTVSGEIQSLDNRLANEEIYLKLAENLESFLARLRDTSAHSSVLERQKVLRLVVREVLVDTDAVVIRHTIPGLDSDGKPSCHLWGRSHRRHSSARYDSKNSGVPGPAFPCPAPGTLSLRPQLPDGFVLNIGVN